MNKVAFLTTIFPMNEQFLIDFFESLVLQTHKGFDVVVVNDGYANFNEIKLKYSMLNIVELKHCDTPAKNREYGINYCIECRYKKLIDRHMHTCTCNVRRARSSCAGRTYLIN